MGASSRDAAWISGKIREITAAIESFDLQTTLHIENEVEEVLEVVENIQYQVRNLPDRRSLFLRSFQATFESEQRELCWDDTRTGILLDISQWIGIDGLSLCSEPAGYPTANTARSSTCIYWINGSAGTGKTTIAATVADRCLNTTPNVLGASFFCSRDSAESSSLGLVFTTIADQLAQFDAAFGEAVAAAREANPDIRFSFPEYQLRKLIVEPLHSVRNSFQPCVVVIDALDECKDPAPTSTILAALSQHVEALSPLKFIVTSRPEVHITRALSLEPLNLHTSPFHLHEVALEVVQQDIERYLAAKLSRIARVDDWPTTDDVRTLAELSSGLFIFASTAVKFIDSPDCDPREQLLRLIQNVGPQQPGSPTHRLDGLYTQVFKNAYPKLPEHILPHLRRAIGSIVLLQNPLPPFALAELLDLDLKQITPTLSRFQSVILFPTDPNRVIRLLHPSFFDFISSPNRCPIPELRVDVPTKNSVLAECCLKVMLKDLHRDMCEIGDPSLLNSEIPSLSGLIEAYIAPHVQYACRHWVHHVLNGHRSETLLGLLDTFVDQHLLHWIEVCSLLGDLRSALTSVAKLSAVLSAHGSASNNTILLLNDSERFMQGFFPVISVSSLQIYSSALLFTPTETALKAKFGNQMRLAVKTYRAAEQNWSPCLRVIGIGGLADHLVLSPDGSCIASVFGEEVHIWDAITGSKLHTLRGRCMAFSRDGARFAACSRDYDTTNYVFPCGQGHIHSLNFFPDGTRIIFCAEEEIHIYDVFNFRKVHLPNSDLQLKIFRSVALSPDGTRIAGGSHKTLFIVDATTGARIHKIQCHADWINLVAFSPDGGTRIASAAMDKSICIWDSTTGVKLQTLEGHSNTVSSFAFSPQDGRLLVSGSDDTTLRVWDVGSGVELHTFRGHSGSIYTATFSPQSSQLIISGSWDATIRIWGLPTQRASPSKLFAKFYNINGGNKSRIGRWRSDSTNQGQSTSVLSMAWSPDDAHLISSEDKVIRVWDVISFGD
ncbi:quinon protein alcohol dehydrogenase-like superfamily [Roridomyces roridus]|uniref:Quinon protein alcohol dehydrogenase-like superfamily n=1 Tax=Roridomyces roridus TaxID=1738132 RepID=A0AAD7B4R4_9AGAR|nr:quinon protein alcohol dehydrogenase-like superfamily [Roridomyces roridus]